MLIAVAWLASCANAPVFGQGDATRSGVDSGRVPVHAGDPMRPTSRLPSTLSIERAAGGELVVIVTVLNESGSVQSFTVPENLRVSTSGAGPGVSWLALPLPQGPSRPWPVASVALSPGQFLRLRYRLVPSVAIASGTVLRAEFEGTQLSAVLDLPAEHPVSIASNAQAADASLARVQPPAVTPDPNASVAAAAAAVAADPGPDLGADSDNGAAAAAQRAARTSAMDRFGSALSPHEPVYIGFGYRSRRTARFQLSFKYRFFNEEADLARELTALRHLYFGYTQNSLWDLEADSAPFRDSSYRPSLFYRNDLVWISPARDVRFGFHAGLEHESNGRDGVSSRSVNTAYVRPVLRFGDPTGWHFSFGPKIHAYLGRAENPDIARYRGHADLFASYGHPDRWQFAATLRRGTDSKFGSTLLEASYPLRAVTLGNLDGYLYFQFFGGYGETLFDYNRRQKSQVRAGLAITRWP